MIGFKPIEEFTFDDCVKYMDSHNVENDDFFEISSRYNKLLNQLRKSDDENFHNCQSIGDYEKYLCRFSTVGHFLYKPMHNEEAVERINQLKKHHEKKRKTDKKLKVLGVILGLLIGCLSQRFLPYLVASLINGDSADWGIIGFPISYGILLVIFIFIRIIKKNILYNRYIAFFGGMVISCIPMFFYLEHNEVAYGRFSDYGIFYGGKNGRVGIADSFGNTIIPRNYDCFYETSETIIGVIDNHGSLSIDWYTKNDFKSIKSGNYWIVNDEETSMPFKKVLESNSDVIIDSWRFNNINVVTRDGEELPWPVNPIHNSWRDPEILELRVRDVREV